VRVVLLPGLDGTGDLFDPLVARTPDGMTTDVVSYPHNQPLSYSASVRHVTEALEQLDHDDPFVIAAESFSGPVAVSIAADKPENLRGLVLCNTFVKNPLWSWLTYLPIGTVTLLPHNALSVGGFLTGPGMVKQFIDPIRAANSKVHTEVLARRIREVLAVDVREKFKSLAVPVLWLRGLQDTLITRKALMVAAGMKPDMDVAEIRGPHLLFQVEPEACWREMVGFVERRCRH